MNFLRLYSSNYDKKPRKLSKIRFLIIHYTGMQSERVSLKKLTNPKSKVSCHYFINRKGKIIKLVDEKFTAWHAGKSRWLNYKNLNNKSIGIELENKGHDHGYQNYPSKQINSLINLCLILKKKYKIRLPNFLGHSDIAPLRKKDPGEKFPWEKLSKQKIGIWFKSKKIKNIDTHNNFIKRRLFFKNLCKIGYRYFSKNKSSKNDKYVILAFQRKYLPKNLNGVIDQKTLKTSHFLANLKVK